MIPVRMIITAANTVSLARVDVSDPPASIKEIIKDTSMTVTAMANNRVPKGSPIR